MPRTKWMKAVPWALVLILALSWASRAVEPEAAAEASLEALYDLDYEGSLERLRPWIEEDPDDFLGTLSELGVLWWWEAAEPGTLKRNAERKTLFDGNLRKILRLAKPRFKAGDPKTRADAYFSAGLALGIRAQWNLSRGRWLRAYLDGKKGKSYHLRCLETDPGYYDAYLGIGLFDYLTGRLPGVLKIGLFLFTRGDTESGMKSLRLAAEKGRFPFAATQAASNLLNIHVLYDDRGAEALDLLRGLLAKFPSSPYFRFVEVVILDRTGDWDASHRRALDLFRLTRLDRKVRPERRMSLYCGMAPARCLAPETLEGAVRWLTRAVDFPEPGPAGWKAHCRLMRGLAYDALKRRPEAVSDYAAVLAGPPSEDGRAIAARCLKAPCRKKEVLRLLAGGQ